MPKNKQNDQDRIIEAVPNFAEGRRLDVVDQIVEAICAPGVLLLNRTSDHDHNRTVLTVAGPPAAVVEGLFRAVRSAAAQINLFEQEGVHPRLGATDVVPLVPIKNISLAECAALATTLGARIGQELQLPVYLYEAAATRPERRNLADLRRGQFERLVEEIRLPARAPDFGPAIVGPAGAVIVGARNFLIAYNVFLKSSDVAIAKRISRQIRASNGGLPAVKALGLLVDGQAQVSMNLVDFRQSSIATVFDRIAALAQEQDTEIDRSELIGLMPEEAMRDVVAHYLRLPALPKGRIIENAIDHARNMGM